MATLGISLGLVMVWCGGAFAADPRTVPQGLGGIALGMAGTLLVMVGAT